MIDSGPKLRTTPLAGYSIVEVMVAAGILLVGIAAAASLALTTVAQEEGNAAVTQALNMQEQAARLYHLGLDPGEIEDLLPYTTNAFTISFTTNTGTVSGVGTMDAASCLLAIPIEPSLTAINGTTTYRTNTLELVRPTVR